MHGRFHFFFPNKPPIIVPNRVVDEGEQAFLRMILRADVSDVTAGGNFFIGLCEQIPDDLNTLTDITTEPTSQGGYARQAITRDATGWPTESFINGDWSMKSASATFAASAADFSRTFQRAFLCNVASGTAGKLFAYSGPLPNPLLVTDGNDFQMQYEFFLR